MAPWSMGRILRCLRGGAGSSPAGGAKLYGPFDFWEVTSLSSLLDGFDPRTVYQLRVRGEIGIIAGSYPVVLGSLPGEPTKFGAVSSMVEHSPLKRQVIGSSP